MAGAVQHRHPAGPRRRPVLYLRNAMVTVQPARPGRVLVSAGDAGLLDVDMASAIELYDALGAAISDGMAAEVRRLLQLRARRAAGVAR